MIQSLLQGTVSTCVILLRAPPPTDGCLRDADSCGFLRGACAELFSCTVPFNLSNPPEKRALSLPSDHGTPVLGAPCSELRTGFASLLSSEVLHGPPLPQPLVSGPSAPNAALGSPLQFFLKVPSGLCPQAFEPALPSICISFPLEGHVASPFASSCPY